MSELEQEFLEAFNAGGAQAEPEEVQEEPPAPEVAEEPAEVAEVPEVVEEQPRKWGGLFDTPEELEADYQARLGRLTNEVGERRQAEEELRARLAYLEQTQRQEQVRQQAPSVEDDPRQVVAYALQNGDMDLYNQALAAWAEEAPGEAIVFSQRVAQAQINAGIATALSQRDQVQNTTKSAWDNARARLEGFDSLTEQMVQAAHEIPNFEQIIQTGSQEQKEQAFATAYWMARGMAAAPAAPAAPQAHPLAERAAAFVTSPTNGGAPQGTTQSRREREADEMRAAFERGLQMMSE